MEINSRGGVGGGGSDSSEIVLGLFSDLFSISLKY